MSTTNTSNSHTATETLKQPQLSPTIYEIPAAMTDSLYRLPSLLLPMIATAPMQEAQLDTAAHRH
jgi:hypothetical protein